MSIEKRFYAMAHKYDCKTAIQAQRAHKFDAFAFFRGRYYGEDAFEATREFLSVYSEGEVTQDENHNFHWAETVNEKSHFYDENAILTHEILNALFAWVVAQLEERGEVWSNAKYRIASLLEKNGKQKFRVEISWAEVKIYRNYETAEEDVARFSMEKFVERFKGTGKVEFLEIFE